MRSALLCAFVLVAPAPAIAQEASEPARVRAALRGLERVLDGAVSRVAPPSAMALLAGPGGSHGYHLEGVGAFFVLPPRRLPSQHHVFLFQAPPGRLVLEGPEGQELAERMEALHAEAERMNAEAERAYRRVRREIHVRLREEGAARDAADTSGDPPEGPHPLEPPWRFWFEMDSPEPSEAARASADELVVAVGGAITAALESDAARLPMLAPEEFVAVAVDFVADPFLMGEGRGARTLVLRARHGDLEARRRGDLTAEQLRERISSQEY